MTFPVVRPQASATDLPLHQITDHEQRALSRLLEQFKDKPRLATLIAILVRPFQELEAVFWDLRQKVLNLDAAEGAQLDLIGRILREPRGPFSDTDYRAILRVKIRVLKSSGTGPDLMQICDLMLQGVDYTLTEYFPAAAIVNLLALPVFDESLLARFLRLAKSAGVRLDIGRPGPSGNTLLCASVTTGGGAFGCGSVTGGGGLCSGVI